MCSALHCSVSCQVNCEHIDVQKMWGKVTAFAQGTPSSRVPYKIVVLDGADRITSTSQQMFKKVFAETEKKTKYIFICRSLGKLTGHVLAKGAQYSTHLALQRDALGGQQHSSLLPPSLLTD